MDGVHVLLATLRLSHGLVWRNSLDVTQTLAVLSPDSLLDKEKSEKMKDKMDSSDCFSCLLTHTSGTRQGAEVPDYHNQSVVV